MSDLYEFVGALPEVLAEQIGYSVLGHHVPNVSPGAHHTRLRRKVYLDFAFAFRGRVEGQDWFA